MSKRAVGTPCLAMNAFAKALLDSGGRRAAVGPERNDRQPRIDPRSPSSAELRTDMVRLICSRSASASAASGSAGSSARCARAGRFRVSRRGDDFTNSRSAASRATSACSRAPLPRREFSLNYRLGRLHRIAR